MANYINKMRLGTGDVINPSNVLNQSLQSITDLLSKASLVDAQNKELAIRKKESESKLLTDMLQQKLIDEQYKQSGGGQDQLIQEALKDATSTNLFDDKEQINVINQLYKQAKNPEDVQKLNDLLTANGTRNDWSFLTKTDKNTAVNNMKAYLISKGVNPVYAEKIAPTYATKFTRVEKAAPKEQITALTGILKQDPHITDKTTKQVGGVTTNKQGTVRNTGFLSTKPFTIPTDMNKWLESIGIDNSIGTFSGEKDDIPFIIRDFNRKVHEYTGKYPSEAAIKTFLLENLDQGMMNNTVLDSRSDPKAFDAAIKVFLKRNKSNLFSVPNAGNSMSKREVTVKKYSDAQKAQIAQAKEALLKLSQPKDPLTRLLSNIGATRKDIDFLFTKPTKTVKPKITKRTSQIKRKLESRKVSSDTQKIPKRVIEDKKLSLTTDLDRQVKILENVLQDAIKKDNEKVVSTISTALNNLLIKKEKEKNIPETVTSTNKSAESVRLQKLIDRYSSLGNTQAVEQLRAKLKGL